MRDDAESRQDRDVNLRMSEEPEQVLPQQRRSARVGLDLAAYQQIRRYEETRSRSAVKQ